MKPQKFIQSYKCDCFQPHNYCNCSHKIISSDILIENVNDIAESLVEVMNLCGIYLVKAKASIDIIIYYFLHFEEIIHRIDSIPKKRFCKEDLIHDLSRKCSMDRIEAQMACSIIKRAFKAFYHGTDMGGVPNNLLSDQLTHTSECLWVHAAKRTAQIYAAYEGLFYACQKDLECKIKLIYKQLYDRISNRNQPDDEPECTCMKCFKRIAKESLKSVKVTTGMHDVKDPYEAIYLKEQEEDKEKQRNENCTVMLETLGEKENERKQHCSCPSLNITAKDYVYREIAESTYTGSSQGPFDCRWISISTEEFEADEGEVNVKLPNEFPCPPCHTDEECETECECSCEDCTCKSDDDIVCGESYMENGEDIEKEFSSEETAQLFENYTKSESITADFSAYTQ
ncbi:hypothetical protein FF38_11664 [Lucilia cuprina]|uniref:Uncharacterized protein n=1 Tax=Lucilia cuprina TaxID=7375 RepID=A0A0L0CES7_LUCCU|nr:hypothetical protein CVS40_6258 [Lucilia cuprina]KNC30722.1 hypothetical protein FF38_11664 [Lucilia cuprina]